MEKNHNPDIAAKMREREREIEFEINFKKKLSEFASIRRENQIRMLVVNAGLFFAKKRLLANIQYNFLRNAIFER